MSIVYLAPLEGVTDAIFRQTHHACFGGVSKYFIPFVSPTQNLVFTSRDLSAVAPEHNIGVPAVPQLLAKDSALFNWAAGELAELGYSEVNLNLGCPSGTVTAKGKGSGLLADYPALERFLDGIFGNAPLPISIKTRIGYTSADEFERLLALFSRYPVHELIIHPRTRAEFYKGTPHRDVFTRAFSETTLPLCFNGDLFSAEDCRLLTAQCPQTHALMIGRAKSPSIWSAALSSRKSRVKPSVKPPASARIPTPSTTCSARMRSVRIPHFSRIEPRFPSARPA